jgi:hypothetical protein
MIPAIPTEIAETAACCRHYAMCKIDYLDTGVCPAGAEKYYVSYFPQGRMDLCRALAAGKLPLTPALVDIARTCDLCGVCDIQCHFVTGLRPFMVMKALKDRVEELVAGGAAVEPVAEDEPLRRLRAVVGTDWAANDPAILLTYADDPFPLAGPKMPSYVVLPGNRDEVAAVVALAGELGLPYAVRGNGASVFGLVYTEGIVLDMNRMKDIEIDADNWSAAVGPGVTSFELQAEAYRRGFRVNAAEPAATVCGNIICTGTFSTWSNVYGTGADNFIDLEFVDPAGKVVRFSDRNGARYFALDPDGAPSPGVCTRAWIKLHPMTSDEEGLLVPFQDRTGALRLARDLARRRIGLAVAVLGGHYIANFLSPSRDLAARLKKVLPEVLGMEYAVLVIGDAHAREAVKKMAGAVIDDRLFRTLLLGLPRLLDGEWLELARQLQGPRPLFELLTKPETHPLLEAVLNPSAETLAGAADADLRKQYMRIYSRPEMADMVWLNMFRIVSARMARDKHVFAFLVYLPPDREDVVDEVVAGFARAAEAHGIDHDFGFITPIDMGKRAVLEYDYYIDHTDEKDRAKVGPALAEIGPWFQSLAGKTKGMASMENLYSKGCTRKEFFLYL